MASPGPSVHPCPDCDGSLPSGLLCCPHCGFELVEADCVAEWELRARELARRIRRQPWFASSGVLSYVQRSLERGFVARFADAIDAEWLPFVERLQSEVPAPASDSLLTHLLDKVVREESRAVATYLERRRQERPR